MTLTFAGLMAGLCLIFMGISALWLVVLTTYLLYNSPLFKKKGEKK